MAMGSSLRLPLVAISGKLHCCINKWWSGEYGSITPK